MLRRSVPSMSLSRRILSRARSNRLVFQSLRNFVVDGCRQTKQEFEAELSFTRRPGKVAKSMPS